MWKGKLKLNIFFILKFKLHYNSIFPFIIMVSLNGHIYKLLQKPNRIFFLKKIDRNIKNYEI